MWPHHFERKTVVSPAEKIILLARRHAARVRLVHDTTEEEQQVVYINKGINPVLDGQRRHVQTAAAELVGQAHLQGHSRVARCGDPVDAAQLGFTHHTIALLIRAGVGG